MKFREALKKSWKLNQEHKAINLLSYITVGLGIIVIGLAFFTERLDGTPILPGYLAFLCMVQGLEKMVLDGRKWQGILFFCLAALILILTLSFGI